MSNKTKLSLAEFAAIATSQLQEQSWYRPHMKFNEFKVINGLVVGKIGNGVTTTPELLVQQNVFMRELCSMYEVV